jgi:hypothetical protein
MALVNGLFIFHSYIAVSNNIIVLRIFMVRNAYYIIYCTGYTRVYNLIYSTCEIADTNNWCIAFN